MDPSRFDHVARHLGGRRPSRRAALRGAAVAAAGLAAAAAVPVGAQEATPATDSLAEDNSTLFVQTAASGSFVANPGSGTPEADGTPTPGGGAAYLLTLEGHPGGTVYFSDRPERVFGEAPTQQFLDGLGFSPSNPPNAALVVQTDADEGVVILELVTPAYDEVAGTITYGANVLADYAGEGLAHVAAQQLGAALPERFGRVSLFIDDCPNITTCEGIDYDRGPVPNGPYGQCWSWSHVTCRPCRNYGDLDALCNETYPSCDGECTAV